MSERNDWVTWTFVHPFVIKLATVSTGGGGGGGGGVGESLLEQENRNSEKARG